MNYLTLQITRENLDKIILGLKPEEYREIRPKNSKKYIEYFIADDGEQDVRPKKYDGLKLLNGYAKNRPEVIIKYKNAEIEYIVDKEGNFIEYVEDGQTYLTAQMVYSLGKIISKKNI
jgi:hypothetical protein